MLTRFPISRFHAVPSSPHAASIVSTRTPSLRHRPVRDNPKRSANATLRISTCRRKGLARACRRSRLSGWLAFPDRSPGRASGRPLVPPLPTVYSSRRRNYPNIQPAAHVAGWFDAAGVEQPAALFVLAAVQPVRCSQLIPFWRWCCCSTQLLLRQLRSVAPARYSLVRGLARTARRVATGREWQRRLSLFGRVCRWKNGSPLGGPVS